MPPKLGPFAHSICSVFEANRHHQLQNLKNFYHMMSLNSSEDVGCEPPFRRSQRVFQDARRSKQMTDWERASPAHSLTRSTAERLLRDPWDGAECSTTLSVLTVQQSSSVPETNPNLGNTRHSWKGLSKIYVIFIYEYFLTDVDYITKATKLGALKLIGYL